MDKRKQAGTDLTAVPFAPTAFAEPDVAMTREPDGTVRLKSNIPLCTYDRQVGVWLRRWAEATPNTLFLAERQETGGWREVTYAETRRIADRLSRALLDLGLGPDRPLVILSEKSIDQALLMLAAMQVGIPVTPISPDRKSVV